MADQASDHHGEADRTGTESTESSENASPAVPEQTKSSKMASLGVTRQAESSTEHGHARTTGLRITGLGSAETTGHGHAEIRGWPSSAAT